MFIVSFVTKYWTGPQTLSWVIFKIDYGHICIIVLLYFVPFWGGGAEDSCNTAYLPVENIKKTQNMTQTIRQRKN